MASAPLASTYYAVPEDARSSFVKHAHARPCPFDNACRRLVLFAFRGDEYCVVVSEPSPRSAPASDLTPAEERVFALLRAGSSYEQIATARGRSRHTIAKQVASIFRKLKVASLRDLELFLSRTP